MGKETIVFLVRHCQGEGNVDGRLYGRTDHQVTEEGRKQLEVFAKLMAPVPLDAVYTSPLARAKATAEAGNLYHGAPLFLDEGLIEADFGELDGQVFEEFARRFPEVMAAWRDTPWDVQYPGGESTQEIRKRTKESFWRCVNQNRGKVLLLASHGSALRALMSELSDLGVEEGTKQAPRLRNTALSCYAVSDDDQITAIFLGKEDHLEPEKAEALLNGLLDEEILAITKRIQER
ncbi:MAG: histidine phosphatase family protein [Oscillospiraceae bacterium]|nr:histidine phosphatase family protein [Oscillospiraceae bacterium]